MQICEGILGYWHYHYSENGAISLCGKPVMKTSIPAEDFGKSFGKHFPKKPTWCKECAAIAKVKGQ